MLLKNRHLLLWLFCSQQLGKRKKFEGGPSGSARDGKRNGVAEATMMLLYKNETNCMKRIFTDNCLLYWNAGKQQDLCLACCLLVC